MELLGYFFSILIGISLGLIGAGGSILTVPILVYLFAVPADQASSYSLFIVGLTSLFAAYRHYKMGNLHLRSALYFAIPSIATLLLVRKLLLPAIPGVLWQHRDFVLSRNMLLMSIFGLLMVSASLSMIRTGNTRQPAQQTSFMRILPVALIVGVVTGLLGAGGGFLIIPALVLFTGLPMKQAVGTSLLIIFINSVIGFGGDLLIGASMNWPLLLSVSGIAVLGMLLGTQLSKKIDGSRLRPGFGWFVLVMGIYIIVKELLVS